MTQGIHVSTRPLDPALPLPTTGDPSLTLGFKKQLPPIPPPPPPAPLTRSPLVTVCGGREKEIPIKDPALRTRLDGDYTLFQQRLTHFLTSRGEDVAGLKCRYDFSREQILYTTAANHDVQVLKLDLNNPDVAHQALVQAVKAAEDTVAQIRGQPIEHIKYNGESLTLDGGSHSYTKIESSALNTFTKMKVEDGLNEVLKQYTKRDAAHKPFLDGDAQTKIEGAITKYTGLKRAAKELIEQRERDLQAAPTVAAKAVINKKIKSVKEYQARLENMDGFAMGLAILANVTDPHGKPKKCSALIEERNHFKPEMVLACRRFEEEDCGRLTKVGHAFQNRFNKDAAPARQKAREESVMSYADQKPTRLMLLGLIART